MAGRLWIDYVVLSLVLGMLFLFQLGVRPLASPDEGRYAEIPREMVVSGDYMTPHLNGLPYFEKPPFVYWLEALPIKLGLMSEFFLRLPIALFALLGCLIVFSYSHRIYGRIAGYTSAIVLGTSLLYFSLSRLIILDLVLTVFMTGGLLYFLQGIKSDRESVRRFYLALSSIFCACAVLTKGLIGLFLPLIIMGMWTLCLNKWREIRPLYLPTNMLIFLGIVLPWHIIVSLKNPSFFNFYFVHEHIERYLTTVHRRYQPFWFFIPVTLLGFFPWIFFLPRAIKNFIPLRIKDWKIYDMEAFLILWVGLVFLFFSCSSSKLIPYILPIFPPLSIVVGRFLGQRDTYERRLPMESIFYLMGSCALIFWGPQILKEQTSLKTYAAFSPYILWIKIFLVGGGSAFFILNFLKANTWRWSLFIVFHIGFLITLNEASPLIQKPSMKSFARHMNGTKAEAVTFGMYPQDLPFYLGRTVNIMRWHGELDHGRGIEPNNSVFLSDSDFQQLWKQSVDLCVITKKSMKHEVTSLVSSIPHVIAQEDECVLMCKKPGKLL